MTSRNTSSDQHKEVERVYLGSSGFLMTAYITGFAASACLILALVARSSAPAERAVPLAIICLAATWLFRRSVHRRDGGYPLTDPSVQPQAAWRTAEIRFRRRPLHVASIYAAGYSALYFTFSGLGALLLGYGPAVPLTYAITAVLTSAIALLSRRRGPYVRIDQHLARSGPVPGPPTSPTP